MAIDTFISINEVKKIVNLSSSTIYFLIKKDEFPKGVKFGNRTRWSVQHLTAWLEAKKAKNGQLG
ncbi:MAG: AlpA family phage regulatory protein [Deltaproteobacteria bacterium]|jgi:predicted DNA-binding transcriptional regulator AlpA|nr:AlpA family phage regulatory protein [Deltaproteobacteria bacterium]